MKGRTTPEPQNWDRITPFPHSILLSPAVLQIDAADRVSILACAGMLWRTERIRRTNAVHGESMHPQCRYLETEPCGDGQWWPPRSPSPAVRPGHGGTTNRAPATTKRSLREDENGTRGPQGTDCGWFAGQPMPLRLSQEETEGQPGLGLGTGGTGGTGRSRVPGRAHPPSPTADMPAAHSWDGGKPATYHPPGAPPPPPSLTIWLY